MQQLMVTYGFGWICSLFSCPLRGKNALKFNFTSVDSTLNGHFGSYVSAVCFLVCVSRVFIMVSSAWQGWQYSPILLFKKKRMCKRYWWSMSRRFDIAMQQQMCTCLPVCVRVSEREEEEGNELVLRDWFMTASLVCVLVLWYMFVCLYT